MAFARTPLPGLLGLLACVWWAAGCSEESALSLLGEGCSLNSDCDEGLACSFGMCHAPCATSKDCAAGRCVVDERRGRVCQFEEEETCRFNSQCPTPLVCGRDGACRNQCEADRDCVPGQVCRSAVCADPEELDGGTLPSDPEVDPIGQPCTLSTNCPPGPGGLTLVCRSGACAYACFEPRDCARYYRCTTADDPGAPGDCVLIGPPGQLVCDPALDPVKMCLCPGGQGTQKCREDGTGYEMCSC